ncbi:MAG TPA: hypothetical protein VGI10_04650 [Polyangiaceae bacterium]
MLRKPLALLRFFSTLPGRSPWVWLSAAGGVLLTTPAIATTTLTVDLSTTIRPVTHVGNGSLYGVTETLPADVNGLIAPLHPNMFTNPAVSGHQQPWGDAIVVAGRVEAIGAKVTIRLADWFPGWYSFTNMTDWLSKVDQTVARKKAAGLSNVYAYEIWNEPNGTWAGSDPNAVGSKPLSFNQMWLQTYQHLRQVDPGVKITGPSLAGYNSSFMQSFLSFCKTNNCLPDIAGWHEGTGISNDVQNYRNIEKQLGIGPLPITMNEYSGYGQINDEGRPGASAPLIAQLERSGVETACITYWDVPHPGRLGSLLATNTDRNGGWFFYKWYGEMTGNMVSTTSSLSVNGTNLDGVASLDQTAGSASVILGGINDGTVQLVVKGFHAAPTFGSKVHAVVEHSPFTDRSTIVSATDTRSTQDLTITNDQISVLISNTNANDGYHLSLTLVGGSAGAGGAGGTGGGAGAGAGNAGASGSSGVAGSVGASGAGSGGTSGGAGAAGGGMAGSAGTSGAAGAAGSLVAGTGGSVAAGGSSGTVASGGAGNGAAGNGVAGSANGGGPAMTGDDSPVASAQNNASCSCSMPGNTPASDASAVAGVLLLGVSLGRRRGRISARAVDR